MEKSPGLPKEKAGPVTETELPPRPWGRYELEEGCDLRIEVGPLALRVRRIGTEVWMAHVREDEDGTLDDESAEWTRWAAPEGSDSLRLSPCFPDRTLVVQPENPFHLLRGARIRVYVRVPLRVRLELEGQRSLVLSEIPTVILSDTWFGDVMEGELSYYLPTTARRTIEEKHFQPHLVACPIQLSNVSDDNLEVRDIALRVAHLSVFSQERRLWADETRARYRGASVGSDLRMSGKPPTEASDATLVCAPAVPAETGLRARTFARLMGRSFGSAS